MNNVKNVEKTIGCYDLVVELESNNEEQLRKVIGHKIKNMELVKIYTYVNTYIVFNLKYSYEIIILVNIMKNIDCFEMINSITTYRISAILLSLVFTVFSIGIVSVYGDYSTNQEMYEKAELLFSQKNYQESLELYEKIIETDPDNANTKGGKQLYSSR